MSGFDVRTAQLDDIPFLVEAIRESERLSGDSNECMYRRIYGLTETEVTKLIVETLSSETEGHQLSLGSFLVVSHDYAPVGCCAHWIEQAGVRASGTRLAMIISRSIGLSRWRARAAAVRTLSASAPPRSVGALQLESFFVTPEFRGRGIVRKLVEAAITSVERLESPPSFAEISLLVENEPATRAYYKIGFEPVIGASMASEQFAELTGSGGFIQLRRSLASPTDQRRKLAPNT